MIMHIRPEAFTATERDQSLLDQSAVSSWLYFQHLCLCFRNSIYSRCP